MTKKKVTAEKYSPLQLAQYELRLIAAALKASVPVPDEIRTFLADALSRIGSGEDANRVLGVVAKRGERRTPAQRNSLWVIEADIRAIASLMRPPYNLTFEKAAEGIASDGDGGRFTVATLTKYWKEHPEWRSPTFGPSIDSMPIFRPPKRTKVEPKF